MDKKALKILGAAASIIGVAVSLLSNWVDGRMQEKEIDEKVREALSKNN